MDILVRFDERHWRITPDPAIVTVGTPLTWVVRSKVSPIPRLRWTVYFNHGTPFRGVPRTIEITTLNARLGTILARRTELGKLLVEEGLDLDEIVDHVGVIGPISPEDPGDYKYGIRVVNEETNQPLGDDDPMLIVRRR